MARKKILRITGLLLILLLALGVYYAWKGLPIISGYGAKDLCSCVFVSGRTPAEVIKKELGDKPISLGHFSVNWKDSSATGTVLGMARKKAIYRKGLGCTLVNEIPEALVRAQHPLLQATAIVNNDSLDWPNGDHISFEKDSSIHYAQLDIAIKEAFAEPGKKPSRQTRAVLVLYDGKLIAEQYAPGFDAHSSLTGWSMAKSVTNALVGILVNQKLLNIQDVTGIRDWQNDDRKKITIDQLLHANSGLQWEESYTGPSDVTNMLHKAGDMAAFAIKKTLRYPSGTHFTYSSGTTNILSYLVRLKVGDAGYYQFPYAGLFNKIGMHSAILEPDASGTFVGSSYCFATARDWARFGLLYLYDGIWNGERILPEGWVRYTMTPSTGAGKGEYGAQFWLNAGAPGHPANRTYPDVPTDCFYADGYEGQNVWIIPSKKLVVVKLALQHGNKLDENQFLAQIIRALP